MLDQMLDQNGPRLLRSSSANGATAKLLSENMPLAPLSH